jgi:predicted TIM-barrel fold metal-dependent hydrolase
VLVDINAYVGHWPFKQLKYNTCEALLNRMDRFGVDKSVVTNLNGIFYKNTQPGNLELYQEIQTQKSYKGRLIPFAIINPIYPGWRSDFEKCMKMGMRGIKLYPQYHDYELTDPSCIELVKMARSHDLIVGLTMRMVDSRQRSWMDIEQVAGTSKSEWTLKDLIPIIKEVPDVKYFILNLANSLQLNEEDTYLIHKGKILFDSSGRIISDMGQSIKTFGKDKFAFGTHSPILDYLTGLLRIESLRPDEADEETKELLRSGNALKMLDL